MPGYKIHLAGGTLLGGISLAALNWFRVYKPELPTALVLLSITLLGALFPDTDTDSKGQHFFYGCLAILDLTLMIEGHFRWAAIVGFCALLPALGHHRGWTHTWWAMVLMPLPILILPGIFYHTPARSMLPYYLAALLGYFSHLALDRKF